MKDKNAIIKKLEQVRDLLEKNLDACNMDVEHMQQRVEDMIEEFTDITDFEFEEEEDED
jgi:hypothetical protein